MTHTDHLTRLEAAGLIRLAAASPELAYIFRHALTRDAAYTSLLRGQRRAVHRAAGEVLEALCSTAPLRASAAPLLAEHWAEAGEPARAFDLWELAADQALAQYALPEAIAHLGHALTLAPEVPGLPPARWAALYLKRGKAHYSNNDYQAAWDTWAALLALAERLEDSQMRLAALLEQANQRAIFNPLFDFVQARALGESALALARQLADPAAEAKALWILMRARSMVPADGAEALAAGEASLALARAHGLAEQAAYTLSDLQYPYRSAGQDAHALAALAEALVYWRASRQHHMLADNLNQTASVLQTLGDFAGSERAALEALAISGPTHNTSQVLLARVMLSGVYLEWGHFDQARAILTDLDLTGLGFFASAIHISHAQQQAFLGRYPEAVAIMQAALANVPAGGFALLFSYGLLGYLAYAQAQSGQLAAAEATLRAGQALPFNGSRMAFANYGYYLPLAEAALRLAHRDWPAAQATLTALIERVRAGVPKQPLAEALLMLGQAVAGAGRPEAEAAFTESAATADQYGQRRVAWQAWHALAQWRAAHAHSAAAAEADAHARACLDAILTDLNEPAARAHFLNLPDVQAVLHSAP